MKRILSLGLCVSLVLMLLLAFALPCFAADRDGLSGKPLVVDNAGLLTPAERDALEAKARSISETYGCEVVILTVNGTDGKSAQDYADDFFVYSDYGYGADRSGILFFMDMNERDWHMTTRGTAIKAFTDSDIDYIADQMLGNLSTGNYYRAFETYHEYTEKALSATIPQGRNSFNGNPLVVDNAGLLTPAERDALEAKARSISDAHGCEVVILTVNGTDGKSAQEYAEDYYVDNGYGFGADRSGVLLMVAMENRDLQLEATGMAEDIFNDEETAYLFSKFSPDLSAGNYAEAFDLYLDYSEKMIGVYDGSLPRDEADAINEDFDNYTNPDENSKPNYVKKGIISVILGALGGFLPVSAQKSALKTVRKRRDASGYAKEGSLNLAVNRDSYLYSTVTSHVIQRTESSSSSSGGVHTIGSGHSSTHVHSSGTSFNSHSGKF